jgi:hypothetical protein
LPPGAPLPTQSIKFGSGRGIGAGFGTGTGFGAGVDDDSLMFSILPLQRLHQAAGKSDYGNNCQCEHQVVESLSF